MRDLPGAGESLELFFVAGKGTSDRAAHAGGGRPREAPADEQRDGLVAAFHDLAVS
jgi:hypothetical protein